MNRYGKKPDQDCSYLCPGNKNEKCGGFWRNSIYKTSVDKSLFFIFKLFRFIPNDSINEKKIIIFIKI